MHAATIAPCSLIFYGALLVYLLFTLLPLVSGVYLAFIWSRMRQLKGIMSRDEVLSRLTGKYIRFGWLIYVLIWL